jgi:Spy/CpxP family protein refolding chaperone
MNTVRSGIAGVLVAAAALMAATGFGVVSAADEPGSAAPPPGAGPHDWAHGPGPLHLFMKLGLSADQQASIKAIITAAKPQMKALGEQMRANQQKLMQTKPDDPNYANTVAEVSQSNATLAAERTTQTSELRSKMYAVLTPAQKTQLAALEAEQASRPHGGWHRKGPGPEDAPPPAQ